MKAMKTIKSNELNMADCLGRGIQVYLKDGWGAHYKPIELIEGNMWKGVTSDGLKMTVRRDEIDFVKVSDDDGKHCVKCGYKASNVYGLIIENGVEYCPVCDGSEWKSF